MNLYFRRMGGPGGDCLLVYEAGNIARPVALLTGQELAAAVSEWGGLSPQAATLLLQKACEEGRVKS